jgi:hypothetical protein
LRVNAPKASRAEPRREPERIFFNRLRVVYYDVTGRMPPLTARHGLAGPFARLVAECFGLARVPMKSDCDHDRQGLAVQLINDLAPRIRKSHATRQLRRILTPLRDKCDLVNECRRLLELGEADVLRIPAGVDDGELPKRPAIIGFEGLGKICFWRPPFGYRTIAIKPYPRNRIMRLAERLGALNAAA